MAERKPPRRTRERILETSLALFNREGAPRVTTADIADEMNISPGNLYYHFRNKDEIIAELYAAYQARVEPLLVSPGGRGVDVEDAWLLLHLLFERMWDYRFLYRDLDDLVSQDARLGARFGALLRKVQETIAGFCDGLVRAGTMRASTREIAALATNAVLISTYWMSYLRATRLARDSRADQPDFPRAAYQVLSLIAPYLEGDARALVERLGADYVAAP